MAVILTPEQQTTAIQLLLEWYLNSLEYMDYDDVGFDQCCQLCFNGRQYADEDYEHKDDCRVMQTRRFLTEAAAIARAANEE